MAARVGVVDLGIANLGSVHHALRELGFDTHLVHTGEHLEEITHLILPGVGSFSKGMEEIQRAMLFQPLNEFAHSGKPILGVCLGMQLLANIGHEGGASKGLGLISGHVNEIRPSQGHRVPHVGWNDVHARLDHWIFEGVREGVDFYFVHGCRFNVSNPSSVVAETEYGGEWFPSVIAKGNIVGVQFHPEKSQANGLKMLDNFCSRHVAC